MSEVITCWKKPIRLSPVSPQYDEGFRDGISESERLNAADFDRITSERDALQELLNAADQGKDDLTFQLNDREASRYDWLQAAQAAEKRVEKLEAQLIYAVNALNEVVKASAMYERPFEIATLAIGELSASAEPISPKCCKCNGTGETAIKGAQPWDKRLSIQCDCTIEWLRVQVERDERAEFEVVPAIENGNGAPVERDLDDDPFFVQQAEPSTKSCEHEWTDDGEFLLVCTACGAQEDHNTGWLDMATAPRDGTMLRLLVELEEHSTEDSDQAPTIGANNFENDEIDEWKFAGWCWTHDHFVEGKGTPVGWLPMLDNKATEGASHERI